MDKKVLIFADPISNHTEKWIEGWNLIGYTPVLSGLSDKITNNVNIFNEKINATGGNGFKYLKNIFNFYKVLKNEDPHIINTHYMSSYGLIGALLKKKKSILILSLHGSDIMIDMNRNIIYTLLSKFILTKADFIISVSETMTRKILKNFPLLRDKILTQQYGVNIDLLNKFKQENKVIDIITNRQWKPNSNYPTILKALSNFKDLKIKLVGSDNSNYVKELLSSFNMLRSSSTGMISYNENLSYIGRSKVFISLTTSDGASLSLIEAMYLGAIPIVSDIEPNRELIKDGINGFITSIQHDILMNTIIKALSLNKNDIKKIQNYNKNLVLNKFDFNKNFKLLDLKVKDYFEQY